MSIDLLDDALKSSPVIRFCIEYKIEMSNRLMVASWDLYLRYLQNLQHVFIDKCDCGN